jgi:hypothetical protein
MKLLFAFVMLTPMTLKADVLLDIMMGRYNPPAPVEYQRDSYEEEEYEHGHDYPSDDSAEPEVYHWDNIYLCKWCDVEIIVDPYSGQTDVYYYE